MKIYRTLIMIGALLLSSCNILKMVSDRIDQNLDIYYVSLSGHDTNNGSKTAPFLSLQAAVNRASNAVTTLIFVQQGDYTSNNGGLNPTSNALLITNHNIVISGGYNASFSAVTGVSALKGPYDGSLMEAYFHLVRIENATNVTLSGLMITANIWNGGVQANGGGLSIIGSSNIRVTNCIVSSNVVYGNGGGICIQDSADVSVHGDVLENYASLSAVKGGGYYIVDSDAVRIYGSVRQNRAVTVGAGISVDNTRDFILYASVTCNRLDNMTSLGGGIHAAGNGMTFYGTISCNTNFTTSSGVPHTNSGGGIFLNGDSNRIFSPVYGNLTGMFGGGIYLAGSSNLVRAVISNNVALTNGGGIAVGNGANNSVSDSILTANYSLRQNSVLALINSGSLAGFTLSNCVVGGTNQLPTAGIFEAGSSDTVNHVLMNNIFLTNSLGDLYRDYVNGSTVAIADVNTASYSGAATASGNSVSNN